MLQQYFERTVEIHETLPIFTIIIDTLVEEYTDIRALKAASVCCARHGI